MATQYDANGNAVDTSSGDLSGLLGAVLGKEAEKNTNSEQNTNSSTASQTNSDTNTANNQSTQGSQATNQNTTGSTSSQGTNQTTGSTVNTGTQATTGTINTSNTGTTDSTQVTKTDADLSGLKQVFAQQQGGITPEMLAAIFQQGAKAAPQLAVATSNALGARATGNTPMAQSLNMLNADLTSKAADINRQMLADSANTAGKIADLSKSTSTSGSQSQTSLSSQIQDLLAKNDTTSIVNQLVATLNNQQNQQSQEGLTTNVQNTQATGSTQQQTGTSASQQQQVTATQQEQTKTTINTSVAKSLAAMAAGGIAIDQLFKMATGKGFIGTLADFAAYLKGAVTGSGTTVPPGYFGDDYGPGETPGDTGDWSPDTPAPDDDFVPDPQAGFADGGLVREPKVGTKGPVKSGGTGGGLSAEALNAALAKSSNSAPMVREVPGGGQIPRVRAAEMKAGIGYADGGVPFLPIEMLIKKQNIVGNPDADIEGMLGSLGAGSGGGSSGGGGGSGAPVGGVVDDNTIGSGGAGAGVGPNDSGQTPTTAADTGKIGQTGKTVMSIVGQVIGIPAPITSLIVAAINAANNATGGNPNGFGSAPAAAPQGQVSVSALGPASDDPGMVSEDGEDPDSSGGIGVGTDGGNGNGGPAQGSNDGPGDSSGDSSSSGDSAGDGDGGVGSGGDSTGDSGGGAYADGGEMGADTDEDHEEMMQLFGITRGSEKGSLVFDSSAVSRMHRVLTKNKKPAGYANGGRPGYSGGGQIKGPGTGTSDSIKAKGPGGQIRVANGEYIIPTDVVQKFGVDAFDKLVQEHHVPADMQRAITGE